MNLKTLLSYLALACCIVSCGKDNPAETPAACAFLGSTSTSQTNYYAIKYTENINRDFELREDNFPLKISTREESLSKDTVSSAIEIKTTRNIERTFAYDNEGFLVKRTDHSIENKEAGELGNILYEGSSLPVKKLTTETHGETEFKYESGLLKETVFKQTITFRSAPKPDLIKTTGQTRAYIYDSQKKLTSVTVNDANGSKSTFKYENGLLLSLLNGNGQVVYTYEYVNGQLARIVYTANNESRYQYDSRGNMTQQETVSNNTVFGRTEFTYDTNPNPEKLIPTTFKGIPIPIGSVQVNDAENNLTSEKITQFIAGNPSVIFDSKTTYTYDGKGYPTAAKTVLSTGQTGFVNTTYRYGNCQ